MGLRDLNRDAVGDAFGAGSQSGTSPYPRGPPDFAKLAELSDLLNLRTDLLLEKNKDVQGSLRPTA